MYCSEQLCLHYSAYPDREHSHCATLCLITRRCAQRYWRSKSHAVCLAVNARPTAFAIRTEYVSSRRMSSMCARVSASACTWLPHPGDRSGTFVRNVGVIGVQRGAIPTVGMALCPQLHIKSSSTDTPNKTLHRNYDMLRSRTYASCTIVATPW
jgi:hypothetical protein